MRAVAAPTPLDDPVMIATAPRSFMSLPPRLWKLVDSTTPVKKKSREFVIG
jgi:hypothetical protein